MSLRLHHRCWVSWLGVALLVIVAGTAYGSPTCMSFLKIATLPRIAALGEATVAIQDATWAEANPAHLINVDGTLMTFSHTAWFGDIALETFTIGTSSANHGFGLSVVGLHTEPLERYDALDRYEGTFRFFDLAASASYARRIGRSLAVGVSGKTLYEKIDWDSATGFAVDLGLGYAVPVRLLGGHMAAGLTMRNLGSKMGYHGEDFDLPLTWQGGLSYRAGWLPDWVEASVAVDYVKPREEDGGVLAGLEVEFRDMLAVRMGHRGAYETGDATVGVGLSLATASLDYAFMDLGEALGSTHRISIGFKTGAIFPPPEASK